MPPRWRLPLLALGFVSLALGVAGGLARLTPSLPAPGMAIALHGALMVSGFFGTVIALERAAALDRAWAYAAPLAAGTGGVLIACGFPVPGFLFLAAAAALFLACSTVFAIRQPSLETGTLLAGAAAWLAGNISLLMGATALPWWIAFFVLTIGGERLELSRYLRRRPFSRDAFLALCVAVLASSLQPSMRIEGVALALFAAWLFTYDLARITVRQRGLPRFVALCLLPGYFWLGAGGALLAAGGTPDAALHAVFLGFVFSMVLGHAPVILPAVLRVRIPYRPVLYVPLALLHLSLAARMLGGLAHLDAVKMAGAWGNAGAIALFIATAATLALRR